MSIIPIIGLSVGALGLLYAIYLARWVLRQNPGTEKMVFISNAIATGARAYLFRQYRTLSILLIILAVVIYLAVDMTKGLPGLTAIGFVVGALGSMLAGYLGMYVTTRSASRVAQAAADGGMGKALLVSWRAGAVMGLSLASVALLLISGFYLIFRSVTPGEWATPLVALGFGASLVTLFMRVGGGIYTKAADLGADLVGKIEAGIPEDDPRNPGVIADNVGDNVGDVAGMAADVYESYIVTVTAAIFLADILGLSSAYIEGVILMRRCAYCDLRRREPVEDEECKESNELYQFRHIRHNSAVDYSVLRRRLRVGARRCGGDRHGLVGGSGRHRGAARG
jgi:Inorganic pyrophosphatase